MANYDPKTMTFEEPRVAAVAAVLEEEETRATSDEELSEIDDEEMRDLEEGMGVEMGGGEEKVDKTPKKAKAKKRRRAY